MKRRSRRLALALGVTLVAMAPVAAAAQPAQERYVYGPGMMWGGGWPGMFLGPFFMVIAFAVAVAVVVLMVRLLGGFHHGPSLHHPSYPSARTALDILKERFARGEIDKAEFEDRRRVLGE